MLRELMVGAFVSLCVGCGARNALDLESAGDPSLQCDELDITGVPECTRLNPEALPLARIGPAPGEAIKGEGGDGFNVVSDGELLYFSSEGRIFRVSITGGAPEPVTPPHSAGVGVKLVDGDVYWKHLGVVKRVSTQGGEVEPLVELPEGWAWAVVPDAILSWEGQAAGVPVFKTSISTGETSEIWPGDPKQGISRIRADHEHIYMSIEFDLVRLPLEGGPVETLVGTGGTFDPASPLRVIGGDLLVTEEHVYFGAMNYTPSGPPFGIYQLSKATGSKPRLITPGFPIALAAHAGALFADRVVPPDIGEPDVQGEIVRAPLDGSAVEHIGDSDARAMGNAIAHASSSVAVSDCWVYFTMVCEDEPATYRLVALPWGADSNEP